MLRSIETTATVEEDGTVTLRLPPSVPPGVHRVVLVIEEDEAPSPRVRPPLTFSRYPVGFTDPTFTARREEIYDDER